MSIPAYPWTNDINAERVARGRAVEEGRKLLGIDGLPEDVSIYGSLAELSRVYREGGGYAPNLFTQSGTGAVPRTVEAELRRTVTVRQFGAVGNGVTDDTAAIQAAIDYAISARIGTVEMTSGTFRTTDTIRLGSRTFYSTIRLVGDAPMYGGESPFGGTAIVADFVDRPVINVNAARKSSIEEMTLLGGLDTYLIANAMGNTVGTPRNVDDTVAANWDDVASGIVDSRYSPFAGVTIDAYVGSAPASPYPGSYGDYAYSSNVRFRHVTFRGFTAAVAIQPSDVDGNGDFIQFEACDFHYNKWCVSAGNAQGRGVSFTDCSVAVCYAFLTGTQHGKQTGKFGGAITNLMIGCAINLVVFDSYYFGPIHFDNLYGENMWSLGTIGAQGSDQTPLRFTAAHLTLGLWDNYRGYPMCFLAGGSNDNFGAVSFDGLILTYPTGVLVVNPGATYNKACFIPQIRAEEYERVAHNYLAGGLVTNRLVRPPQSNFDVIGFLLSSSGTSPGGLRCNTDDWWASTRDYIIPHYATRVRPLTVTWDDLVNPSLVTSFDKSILTIGLDGRTLTITFPGGYTDPAFEQFGPEPGDVIWDHSTGHVFFVSARTGSTVTAILQNDCYLDGDDAWQTRTAVNVSTGAYHVGHAGLFTLSQWTKGTLTASSDTITAVSDEEGTASYLEDRLTVGDRIPIFFKRDNWHSYMQSTQITARSNAAKTITLATTNTSKSETRRLEFFLRKPPDNV